MERNQCAAARRVGVTGVMQAVHRYRPPFFPPSANMVPIMGVRRVETQTRITAVWDDTHYRPDRQLLARRFDARPWSPRHGMTRIVKPQNKMRHHVLILPRFGFSGKPEPWARVYDGWLLHRTPVRQKISGPSVMKTHLSHGVCPNTRQLNACR
jgi:hypothetical protein